MNINDKNVNVNANVKINDDNNKIYGKYGKTFDLSMDILPMVHINEEYKKNDDDANSQQLSMNILLMNNGRNYRTS